MIREFEAYFTAGKRTRTVTFTVMTQNEAPLPKREVAPIAFGQLSYETTIPIPNWTLERLVETTDGKAADVE